MQKLSALVTTPSGLSLIALFILGGLQLITPQLTGTTLSVVKEVVLILGIIYHPTDMTAGHSVKRASN